jgi:hypothetical protein
MMYYNQLQQSTPSKPLKKKGFTIDSLMSEEEEEDIDVEDDIEAEDQKREPTLESLRSLQAQLAATRQLQTVPQPSPASIATSMPSSTASLAAAASLIPHPYPPTSSFYHPYYNNIYSNPGLLASSAYLAASLQQSAALAAAAAAAANAVRNPHHSPTSSSTSSTPLGPSSADDLLQHRRSFLDEAASVKSPAQPQPTALRFSPTMRSI